MSDLINNDAQNIKDQMSFYDLEPTEKASRDSRKE